MPNSANPPLTQARREKAKAATRFIEVLSRTGSVRQACRDSGLTRDRVYRWRRTNAAFESRWRAALRDAADLLEEEARRRAVDGSTIVTEKTDASGVVIERTSKHVTSDALLGKLLDGAKPRKYAPRHTSGPTVQVNVVSADAMRRMLADPTRLEQAADRDAQLGRPQSPNGDDPSMDGPDKG